jgi:hypothetical protein
MPLPRYTPQDASRLGRDWYQRKVEPLVDNEENQGKVVVIDIETGEYELDSDAAALTQRILARKPEAQLYALRVGFPAYGKMGGSWSAARRGLQECNAS